MKIFSILLVTVLFTLVLSRSIDSESESDEFLQSDEVDESDENSPELELDEDEEIPDWAGTGVIDTNLRWDKIDGDVILPFLIENGYENEDLKNIKKAMRMIEKDTCVRFRKREKEEFYLSITHKVKDCFSYVGRIGGIDSKKKAQTVAFGKNHCKVGRMAHEFLHALGFAHMQSHPKRNEFIEVLWDNIEQKHFGDFARMIDKNTKKYLGHNFGTPYDFDSILHYGVKHASKNGRPTMKVLKDSDEWTTKIGHNSYLSEGDIQRINAMYKCDSKKRKATNEIDKETTDKKHDDDDDESDSDEEDSDENEENSKDHVDSEEEENESESDE
ncbi:hypothetical protein PVAND_017296 [Polypedilum vanderplanki]|uniref:Metalloendopeptidase n=1 Tax=Polypedilum vanderplanki TaxID=319348 RepID=A0A9J6BHN9_POLVA|nr:hypothetical protein PVAND_017296 [Polypedilum vanderplanki]